MEITWEEAHQIADEIVDRLTQAGVEVVFWKGPPPADAVEHIASIIFDKDHQIWSDRHQEWVAW